MGAIYTCGCRDCDNEFLAQEGGGMMSELLRCPKCGNTAHLKQAKMLECFGSFEALRPHFKGLESDMAPQPAKLPRIRDYYADKPDQARADFEEFLRCIESFVGRCDCGGQFTPWGKIRCPKCKSVNIEKSFIGNVD